MGAGCNACSTTRARSVPPAVRRLKAMSCSLPTRKGRTGTSKRSEASAALGSGVARRRPGEGRVLLLPEHDADLPLFAVAILVNETENARRGAKPLGALFERPDRVRLGQPIDQALNEEIRPAAIGFLGRDGLRPEQLQRRRALASVHWWQFNARRLERNASAICIGTEHIHLCRNASLLIARTLPPRRKQRASFASSVGRRLLFLGERDGWLARVADEVADGVVYQLELRHELVRQPAVAVVDQRDMTLKPRQFAFLSLDPEPQGVSLGDEGLNCSRSGEKHEFDILLGAVLTELRAGLARRFAVYACDIHSRATVSAEHVRSLE